MTGIHVWHVKMTYLKLDDVMCAAENPFRNRYLFNTEPGKVTLIAELRDSETDEVLIRAADLEKELATAAAQITSAWVGRSASSIRELVADVERYAGKLAHC